MKALGVAGALLAACLGAASAGESLTGRWARDQASCTNLGLGVQESLIVTETALRWSDESCRIARMYKTGDTIHIQARCWGVGGERSVPVSMRPHQGRLQVRWDRVALHEMRRCP